MSLTQEQIEKLSRNLSKINLSDPKLTWDLNNILDYIDQLNKVDTTWVIPTVNVVENDIKESWLREDIEKREQEPKDLLNCSNQKVIANQIAITDIMK